MSRKLTRLMLTASVAAGFTVAPMLSAYASDRTVVVRDEQFAGKIQDGRAWFDSLPGDKVRWEIQNGEHTITPKNDDPNFTKWPTGVKPSGKRTGSDPVYEVTFANPGHYLYFCEVHTGMVGVIDVKDQSPATSSSTTTTTMAPTTTTTVVVVPGPTTTTTSSPAASAGTKPPVTAAPAPTTTTAKDKKGKDDKKDETTTTTVPPPPPVDIPDSAIIPVLPSGATGTTTQNGIEAPGGTPEGDAVALLKSKKGGNGKAVKLLIVSGLGLGALGVGTAGYKYANRSSKYFPA